jgi:hypothetical protein
LPEKNRTDVWLLDMKLPIATDFAIKAATGASADDVVSGEADLSGAPSAPTATPAIPFTLTLSLLDNMSEDGCFSINSFLDDDFGDMCTGTSLVDELAVPAALGLPLGLVFVIKGDDRPLLLPELLLLPLLRDLPLLDLGEANPILLKILFGVILVLISRIFVLSIELPSELLVSVLLVLPLLILLMSINNCFPLLRLDGRSALPAASLPSVGGDCVAGEVVPLLATAWPFWPLLVPPPEFTIFMFIFRERIAAA